MKVVEILTTVVKFKHRTILYRDNFTPAEIEAMVRERSTMMSRCTSMNIRNVRQALAGNKPDRRNRKQEGSGKHDRTGKGVAGEGRSSAAAKKKHANSSTKDGGRKYDDMRNKCHR